MFRRSSARWPQLTASLIGGAVMLVFAGCRDTIPAPAVRPGDPPPDSRVKGPVIQTWTVVPTTVRPGDSLRATLTIRNETSDTVRLTSGYGCIAFLDVLSDTTRVPMHGTQFGCTAASRTFVIPPRGALVESYDLLAMIQSSETPYDYIQAPAGVYRLRADVLVLGHADPETRFTVQP
jgi:hypothetical protein